MARITPCLENGKTAYVDFLRDDGIGWGSTEYIVMKSRHPLPNEFAYFLARNARFREFRNPEYERDERAAAGTCHGFIRVLDTVTVVEGRHGIRTCRAVTPWTSKIGKRRMWCAGHLPRHTVA